jgi:hypothetical protein
MEAPKADGPRLLICKSCKVMYKMRPYDGPPEYDMELIELINRHLGQAADPRPESHLSVIFRTDEDTAEKLDMETAVKQELMKNEIDIREYRDDLKVEALRCFNNHNRPKFCEDYESEGKTIGRKIGVPKSKRQYLCYYCPVHSSVVHVVRKKKGMYDK